VRKRRFGGAFLLVGVGPPRAGGVAGASARGATGEARCGGTGRALRLDGLFPLTFSRAL
jgi:hypothetical protein